MRITNQMMVNSTMANIQINKSQMNTLDTQLATQKKINKPSEDPIIAIRALRLRASLDQITQYLGKNIPDASSWMSVTEDALDESYSIVSDLYKYCTQGATDSYSSTERETLAESLDKLVEAYYSQGDVDYAGRHVFTGYTTDQTLTYQSDADAANVDYTISQSFTRDDLSLKTVYTNAYSNDDIINLNVKTEDGTATGTVITPNVADVHRLQLGYKEISAGSFTVNGTDITLDDANPTATVDINGVTATVSLTSDVNKIPGADEIAINSTTGEILLGENVYKKIYEDNEFSFTYNKDNFVKGDINPTMFYDCVDNNTGIVYNKEQEDIEYNVNFSQKLKVNTEAKDAFNLYLGRNVDDLKTAVANRIDVENQIKQVESMMKEEAYSDDASQAKLTSILEGLNKQNDLAKDQMTQMFEKGITQMQGYQQQISNAKADVGNRMNRLDLTKSRLTEQKTNFTALKSENEDIDLEEVVVGYASAELVYNASLTAASKVVKQTLLDFL